MAQSTTTARRTLHDQFINGTDWEDRIFDIEALTGLSIKDFIDPNSQEMKVEVRNYRPIGGYFLTPLFEQQADLIKWTLIP